MELSNARVCYRMEVKRSTSNRYSRSSNSGRKWLESVLFLVFLAAVVFSARAFGVGERLGELREWRPNAIEIPPVVPVPISVWPSKHQRTITTPQ